MTAHKTDGEVTKEEMEIAEELCLRCRYPGDDLVHTCENTALALHQYAERRVAEERAKGEKVADALMYVLPMAQGYAYQHQVGTNQDKIEGAEKALKDWREGDR